MVSVVSHGVVYYVYLYTLLYIGFVVHTYSYCIRMLLASICHNNKYTYK